MQELIGSNGNKLQIAIGERLAVVRIDTLNQGTWCVHTEVEKLQSLIEDAIEEEEARRKEIEFEKEERGKEEKEIDKTDREAFEQHKKDEVRRLK